MHYILIILLFCPVVINAQNKAADSLKTEVGIAGNDPKKLFDIYYKLCGVYMAIDLDTSLEYIKKANDVARKSGLKEELTKSYLVWTTVNIERGRTEEAHLTARTALIQAEGQNNHLHRYYAYMSMGSIYRREANFDSSLYYYLKCLKIAEETDEKLLYGALVNLGVFYTTTDKLDKAEEYYLLALQAAIKQNDSTNMGSAYNNLGIINRERGDYKKALSYYFKTRDIYMAGNDSSDIAFIYNDIGASYSKSGMPDSAEYYLEKSIGIRERMNELIELAYTYNYLGENYERKGDLQNAERYIKKALALAIEIKNNKQNYEAFESLSDFYARNKMYDSAYKYLQHYRFFRDSIRQMDNEKLIAELNTRYETEKKEKRIQEQEFELTKKNYLLGGSAVLLLTVSLLGYSAYRRYQLKQQSQLQAAIMKQQELAIKAVLEAEENERQRIAGDLHDGVGQMMSAAKINLSAVNDDIIFASEQQRLRFENAVKLVDDSCAEVRNVSHNIMPNSLLRNSLAAAVRAFINKIDQHIIKINLHTEGLNEKIDENIEIMLYRVVQECVNNVIKHAGANTLDISLIRENNEVSVMIEDNGKGFNTSDKSKFEGIGMKNIRSRIGYLKGTVEWDSAPGRGTVVSIHVPLA